LYAELSAVQDHIY